MSYKKIQNYINVEGIQTNIDGLTSDLSSLSSSVDNLSSQTVTRTTAVGHYYCDMTNGDDSNGGTSWTDAVKDPNVALQLIPKFIEENTSLHLKGIDTRAENNENIVLLDKVVANNKYFILDGGLTEQEIIAGPYIADIASSLTIGLSSLTMTPDQYTGYFLEIMDGAAAGQYRTIISHDATTFTVGLKFYSVPTGATFRIYRPATQIKNSIYCYNTGAGYNYLQNISYGYTNSYNVLTLSGKDHKTIIQGVMFLGQNSSGLNCLQANTLSMGGAQYDSDTFTIISLNPVYVYLAYSQIDSRSGASIREAALSTFSSVFYNCKITGCSAGTTLVGQANRFRGGLVLQSVNCLPPSPYTALQQQSSNYSPTIINGSSGVGLKLVGCKTSYKTTAGSPWVIQNNTTHGIELENSYLSIDNVITGSDNGGAGIYAHSNSVVIISTGTPTLDGTIGDITIDGTNPTGSWEDVFAGSKIIDSEEFTIVKKA